MIIGKSFYIRVEEDGTQSPNMEFFPPQYSMLSHLAFGEYSISKNINKILHELEIAKNNNSKFSFAADDWCIVNVNGTQSEVTNGFDEFKPFVMNTDFFIELFQEWKEFLNKYENGEIVCLPS